MIIRFEKRIFLWIAGIFFLLVQINRPFIVLAQEEQQEATEETGENTTEAQEETDPTDVRDDDTGASTGISESFWRFGFYEWSTQRFLKHPFYLMTGNKYFKNGRTSLNSTQDNTGIKQHDEKENLYVKAIHALPPFSLEYIMPTELPILTGTSFQFYYTNTWLTDQTASVGNKRLSDVPLIELRSYYYFLSLSSYLFNPPSKNGTDIFYGVGWAYIETTIRNGFRGHGTVMTESKEKFDFLDHYHTKSPVFFQRIGITTSGDNFGITIEIYLMDDTRVFDNPFWNSSLIPTVPVHSKIDYRGVFLRAAFGVYSFWD